MWCNHGDRSICKHSKVGFNRKSPNCFTETVPGRLSRNFYMLYSLLIGVFSWRRYKEEFLARTHSGLIQGKKGHAQCRVLDVLC